MYNCTFRSPIGETTLTDSSFTSTETSRPPAFKLDSTLFLMSCSKSVSLERKSNGLNCATKWFKASLASGTQQHRLPCTSNHFRDRHTASLRDATLHSRAFCFFSVRCRSPCQLVQEFFRSSFLNEYRRGNSHNCATAFWKIRGYCRKMRV